MGAYSNPDTPIDTQSGQYYRNLQENIVSSTVGAINTYAAKAEENKKKNEALKLRVGEEESALYRNLSSTQQQNPTVNFEELYRPQIKRYAELRTGILNGTSADPSKDRMEADKIFASVGNIKNSLVDLSSEGFDEKYSKMGGAGGYATKENDPNLIKSMLIFSNKLPGKKVARFEDNDPSKIVWDIYDGETKIQSLSAEQLKKAANGQGLLKVIPNAADSIDTVKTAVPDVFDQKNGIPTGIIKNEYLGEIYEKELPGQETSIVSGYQKNTKKYVATAKINKEAIMTNQNLLNVLNAKADGFINGSADNSQAILFHNTYIAKSDQDLLAWDKPMTIEQQNKFKYDYKMFVIDGLPKEQTVPGSGVIEKEEIVKQVIIKPTKTPTAPKGGKPTAPPENIEQISKEIYAIDKSSGPRKFSYGGNVVTYDTSTQEFRITDSRGPKDAMFKSKEEVIKYLKDGAKPKLGVKSK
jgi:hypothetical protein